MRHKSVINWSCVQWSDDNWLSATGATGVWKVILLKHRTGNEGGDVGEDERSSIGAVIKVALREGTELRAAEAEGRVARFEWQNISDGKHSRFDSSLYLHVLSAALQEVADALDALIMNVVGTKHWGMCQAVE